MQSGEATVYALAAAVADGARVDWDHAESSACDAGERQVIQQLRRLAAAAAGARGPGTWGPFEIRAELGRGTFGGVYRAWDRRLEREIALKLLDRPEPGYDGSDVIHEARLLARIQHPNVVDVYGADVHDGRVGVCMELITGRTLKDILTEHGPFGANEAALIGRDICRALAAVHQQACLHRDVKAQNVMRESGGRIVLMDLGAGAFMADAAGTAAGTPAYVAPEVLAGKPHTPRSDLYSLGVLLFHLVSGDFPIRATSLADLREQHERGLGRRLRDVRPDLSPSFVRVVDRALAADPAQRPESAGAMEALLERAFGADERHDHYARGGIPAAWPSILPRAVAIGIVALLPLSTGSRVSAPAPPSLPAASQVLLTAVANGTGDPDLDAADEVLRRAVGQSPHFELMPQARIDSMLQRMRRTATTSLDPETAREVALRDGAPLVAYGSISRLAADYVVSLKLELVGPDPRLPRGSWSRTFAAPGKAQVFDAIHDASRWFRTAVGESAAQLAEQDRMPTDVTTSSWKGLQLVHRANAAYSAGQPADAILLLEQATRFDPEFAFAFMRLGDVLLSQQRETDAYVAWSHALQLVDRQQLTDRESLRLRAQYLEDTGDLAGAERAYRTYALHYPNDFYPHFYLGSVLVNLGRGAEALRWFERASRLRPADPHAPTHLGSTLIDLGRPDDAAAPIATLRTLGSQEWAAWLEALRHISRRDFSAALQTFEPTGRAADPFWVSVAYTLRASWRAELGDVESGERELRAGIGFDASQGLRENEATKWLALAELQCRAGNRHGCLEASGRALATSATPRRVARAGLLLARAGLVAEAERHLAWFEQQPDVPRIAVSRLRLRGAIDAARQRWDAAAAAFVAAARLASVYDDPTDLARALRMSGNIAEAERIMGEFVNRPARAYFSPEPEVPGLWRTSLQEYIAILQASNREATPYVAALEQLTAAAARTKPPAVQAGNRSR